MGNAVFPGDDVHELSCGRCHASIDERYISRKKAQQPGISFSARIFLRHPPPSPQAFFEPGCHLVWARTKLRFRDRVMYLCSVHTYHTVCELFWSRGCDVAAWRPGGVWTKSGTVVVTQTDEIGEAHRKTEGFPNCFKRASDGYLLFLLSGRPIHGQKDNQRAPLQFDRCS